MNTLRQAAQEYLTLLPPVPSSFRFLHPGFSPPD